MLGWKQGAATPSWNFKGEMSADDGLAWCRKARTKLARRPWKVDHYEAFAGAWLGKQQPSGDQKTFQGGFRRALMFIDNAGEPRHEAVQLPLAVQYACRHPGHTQPCCDVLGQHDSQTNRTFELMHRTSLQACSPTNLRVCMGLISSWPMWQTRSLDACTVRTPVANAGADAVLGMIPLARELLRGACEVVMVANAQPAINDVTVWELQALLHSASSHCPLLKACLRGCAWATCSALRVASFPVWPAVHQSSTSNAVGTECCFAGAAELLSTAQCVERLVHCAGCTRQCRRSHAAQRRQDP